MRDCNDFPTTVLPIGISPMFGLLTPSWLYFAVLFDWLLQLD